MKNSLLNNSLTITLISSGLALSLSGCSASNAIDSDVTPTSTKEAGLFSKDVNLCITNSTQREISVTWESVSSSTAQGGLKPGDKFCGEGPEAESKLVFDDGSSIFLVGVNPAINYPQLHFNSATKTRTTCLVSGECFSSPVRISTEAFSEGESKPLNVEGHKYLTTRKGNDAWVNFDVEIIQ